jgi:hypothetical protein
MQIKSPGRSRGWFRNCSPPLNNGPRCLLFEELANRAQMLRLIAAVHFPSDHTDRHALNYRNRFVSRLPTEDAQQRRKTPPGGSDRMAVLFGPFFGSSRRAPVPIDLREGAVRTSRAALQSHMAAILSMVRTGFTARVTSEGAGDEGTTGGNRTRSGIFGPDRSQVARCSLGCE